MCKNKKEIKESKKESIILVITFFIFIFLFSDAFALGISPGRATFNFEPGAKQEIQLHILNTEHKNMNVSIKVEGEWSQYVTLNQTIINFKSQDYEKILIYQVRFPSSASEGIKARIIASELIDNEIKGTGVGTRIAVEHQLYITVSAKEPEKEKKEEEEINITRIFVENYSKKTAKIEIEVKNPSNKTKSVYCTMLIFDRFGTLRSQFNSTIVDVEPNETKTIEALWNTQGFEEGIYGGNLTVYYDNETEKKDVIIYLKSDRIEINFGKFGFEQLTKPLEKNDKAKLEIILIFIVLFIIIDVILFIYSKRKKKK